MSGDNFEQLLNGAVVTEGQGAEDSGVVHAIQLADAVRRLVANADHIETIVPGFVKAVWRDGSNRPTGYVSMVVPELFGVNGGDATFDHVGYGLGKLPEVDEQYMVYFGSGGQRWIKLMQETAGFMLYWMERRANSDVIRRTNWPLEDSPVFETLNEFHRPATSNRAFLGIDGKGVAYFSVTEDTTTVLNYSHRHIETVDQYGKGEVVRHQQLPHVVVAVDSFGAFDRTLGPNTVAAAPGMSGVLIGYLPEVAEFHSESLNVYWPEYSTFLRSDDHGESWTIFLRYHSQHDSFTPIPTTPSNYFIIDEQFDSPAGVPLASLDPDTGELVYVLPFFDAKGFRRTTEPGVPSVPPVRSPDLGAYYGNGTAAGRVVWVTDQNPHVYGAPDFIAYHGGKDKDGWRLIRYRQNIPLATSYSGTLVSRSTSGPTGSFVPLNVSTEHQVYEPVAQDWQFVNALTHIYTDQYSGRHYIYTQDGGATWTDLSDLATRAIKGDVDIAVDPEGHPTTGFVDDPASSFFSGICAYIIPTA